MDRSKSVTWSQVKASLSPLDEKGLLNLVRDLYQSSAANKVFLATRLGIQIPEGWIEPYRRIIRRQFYPDRGHPRLDISAARQAVNDFKKVCQDEVVTADLMIYYVEQGMACTRQYGDINASFYASLLSVFEDAVVMIAGIDSEEVAKEYRPRVERILELAGGMGWGLYDGLCDIYYNEYPLTKEMESRLSSE